MHFKIIEKQEQYKSEINRRKEIIKTSVEKSWFFARIKKIYKPLAKFVKRRKEKTHISAIRKERSGQAWWCIPVTSGLRRRGSVSSRPAM